MKCLLIFLGIILNAATVQPHQAEGTEALRTLDAFMTAFNDRDFDRVADLFHYPHVRIAGGNVQVWNTAEDFKAARTPAATEEFINRTGWHHSAWNNRRLIQSSENKVHFSVRFTRYKADGSVIAAYDSLWILTKRDGRWGVQARSSFAQ